ncbi:hypothetical protein WG899_09220 [Paucibacter sp. AS339]|uniref:hypothetical protein n=1 Tax=Paucibacter hankyongi TaxID=3133434 RepID=UPI00309A1D9E
MSKKWASVPLGRSVAWPQPDFMPAARRPSAWMWLWLLMAALLLAQQCWQGQVLREQAQLLDEQWLLLDKLNAAGAGRAAQPGKPAAESSASKTPELQRRAWALTAELRPRPGADWASRWLAVEQALPPGLQLQAMEMDAQALRLEGLSPQADLVMQLVDRLALQARESGGGEVVLTRLQKPEGLAEGAGIDAASAGLRFELVRRRAAGARG